MQPQPLDREAVEALAARAGIDSISELARRIEMSPQHLGRILSGTRPATPSKVVAIAQALGVETERILRQREGAA